MHAGFILRGHKKHQDEVIKWLETRTMSLPYEDKDGNKGIFDLDAQLRPITLWEYIFPEAQKDIFLTTLKFDELNPPTIKMKAKVLALRKALGYDKIPKFDKKYALSMPDEAMKYTEITPIGVKYDELRHKFPNGLTHEFI